MLSNVIGRAYLRGHGVQKAVPTTPGRYLNFIGGVAQIKDARDVPFVLRMPEYVQVEINYEYASQIPEWREKAGKIAPATVVIVGAPEIPPEPVESKRRGHWKPDVKDSPEADSGAG